MKAGATPTGPNLLPDRPTVRVLCLFAGEGQTPDIGSCLQRLQESSIHGWSVGFKTELVDMAAGDNCLNVDLQQQYVEEVYKGTYGFVCCFPPSDTFTRAVFANRSGPRPIRTRDHPMGLPRLDCRERKRAEDANRLVYLSIAVLQAAGKARKRGLTVFSLLVHPEDLGAAALGIPASIWQLRQVRQLCRLGFQTVAFTQCVFNADYPKPTRLLTDLPGILGLGWPGWPVFDHQGRYLGPLPEACGHRHRTKLVVPGRGRRRAALPAVHPPAMGAFLAQLVWCSLWSAQAPADWGSFLPEVADPIRISMDGLSEEALSRLLQDRDVVYIGRGSRESGRPRSCWANPFVMKEHLSRQEVLNLFERYLRGSEALLKALPRLGSKRLLCHCKLTEQCHGDCIIRAFQERWSFPTPGYLQREAGDDIARQWLDAARGYKLDPGDMLTAGSARSTQGPWGLHVGRASTLAVSINAALTEFLGDQASEFKWDAFQVNYNTVAEWHKDDLGWAYLVVVGDFSGGEVSIHDSGPLDSRGMVFGFDTATLHRSYPFDGMRFSILFYSSGAGWLPGSEEFVQLVSMGFSPNVVPSSTSTGPPASSRSGGQGASGAAGPAGQAELVARAALDDRVPPAAAPSLLPPCSPSSCSSSLFLLPLLPLQLLISRWSWRLGGEAGEASEMGLVSARSVAAACRTANTQLLLVAAQSARYSCRRCAPGTCG